MPTFLESLTELKTLLTDSLPLPPILAPHTSTSTFASRTVLVTGGNTGLGLSAASHLLALNARVILGVRTLSKGFAAQDHLLRTVPSANAAAVEVWELDMLSWTSVREFAARAGRLERLDVVVLND